MGSLETWGAIAATFLIIQCIVFNLVWVALGYGLWKGSAWLRTNAKVGLGKADEYLHLGQRYVRQGESLVASPFVRTRARAAGWRATWQRLRGGRR
jgi:hypothetical protein